jgi:predicted hydrocarbon binding protein
MLSNFVHRLLFVKEFDIGEGNTEMIGTKQMVVPLKFLVDMQEANPEKFYELMHSSMKSFFKRVHIELGDEIYNKLEEIFDVFGLGKLKIVDLDKERGSALVEIHDSPLAKGLYEMGHSCSITSGVLAGMFSHLYDKDVHANINKCMAKGAEHCEFIIK